MLLEYLSLHGPSRSHEANITGASCLWAAGGPSQTMSCCTQLSQARKDL